jgi:predicted transglutaminase-like cysteine proteinase
VDPLKILVGAGQVLLGLASLKTGIAGASLASSRLLEVQEKGGLVARRYRVGTINDRVKHIIASIKKGKTDPTVREFAVKTLTHKCGSDWCIAEKDYWGEVQALFGQIRKSVRYTHDIDKIDTFQAARRTLDFRGGDCDDYVITLGSVLQSVGYPVILRIVKPKTEPDYSHILLLVGLPPTGPSQWVALDASLDKPAGWHPPKEAIDKVKDYLVD